MHSQTLDLSPRLQPSGRPTLTQKNSAGRVPREREQDGGGAHDEHWGPRDPLLPGRGAGCTLVELKYTSNDSALFILPDEGKIQDLEAKLIPETLTRW